GLLLCCCIPLPVAPLPVTPSQIFNAFKSRALHSLFRKRDIRHGSRTTRGQLSKSIFNVLRSETKHLQESAHLLKFAERTFSSALFLGIVGHEADAESRANASDGAVNANCAFICHYLFSALLGSLPFHF